MSRTSFVGRDEEIAELAGRFRAGDRLVTLIGPPGAGKTRLAEQFAATRWRGEVVRCSLAGARQLGDVVRSLAAALEVALARETSADDVAQLGLALAARGRCLVVLDNFEQIVDCATLTVAPLLDAAPRARLLCTSRQRLAIAGESYFPLRGLSRDDARALFVERARLVAGATDDDEVVPELLDRLDRLPLAIELCAARSGVLSPRQLLAALAHRFDLLRARSTDVSPRHASMRAAIDVSWELLGPSDQSALACCAVFEGPFSLDAAAAVLGREKGVTVTALEALREQSLLYTLPPERGDDEVRFALFESIRAYAAERLAAEGRLVEAEEAHAVFHAAEGARHAASLGGPRPAEAVRALARVFDELLAVHRRMGERRPALAVEAALAAAALLSFRGPFETERELLNGALRLAEALGDTRLVARVLMARARGLVMRGHYAEARAEFTAARGAAVRAKDRTIEAVAIYGLSAADRESGKDIARAEALAHEALTLARNLGDTALIALCLASAAAAAGAGVEVERAIPLHEEADRLLRRTGQVRLVALNEANLALVCELLGEVEAARAHTAAAITLVEEQVGDEILRGKILWGQARLSFDTGHIAEADAELEELEISARRTGDRELAAQTLLERARRAVITGDRESCFAWLGRAAGAVAEIDSPRLSGELDAIRALADDARPRLIVASDGTWFERPGIGRVELSRRRSLRLIFRRLLAARGEANPVLSVEALVAAGWPDERLHPESGAMRVWTAIRTLRRLGLAAVLVNRDGGYALDPAVAIEVG